MPNVTWGNKLENGINTNREYIFEKLDCIKR